MYQGYDWDTHRFAIGSFDGNGQPQGMPADTRFRLRRIVSPGAPCPAGHEPSSDIRQRPCWRSEYRVLRGSVQSISYDIDPLVWNDYGGRKDETESNRSRH